MRNLKAILASVVLLTLAAVASAPDGANPPGEVPDHVVRPDRLHKPQDTAPREQVVIPRPPTDYRPEGSLLRAAHHQPRRVDPDELRRRKYDLYAGKRIAQSLPAPGGPVSTAVDRQPDVSKIDEGRSLAAFVYWTCLSACIIVAALLSSRILLNRWRREPAEEPQTDLPPRYW